MRIESSSPFIVTYRFYLSEDREEEYVAYWKEVADYFVSFRGAVGSTLYKSDEGYWWAHSVWPSRSVRDGSWKKEGISDELPERIRRAIEGMKACLDPEKELFPEIHSQMRAQVKSISS